MTKLNVQIVVIQLVDNLPEEYVARIADLLSKETRFERDRIMHRIQATIPKIEIQEKVRSFIESWEGLVEAPTPKEMSILILSVDSALKYQQGKLSVELIWTGPKTRYINFRRTDQALIEMINGARERITIVSFAVYKAKSILTALEKAAERGVKTTIVIETPDSSKGKSPFDTISQLGPGLRLKAGIFIWPFAKRDISPKGEYGSLHAKVAICDSKHLFVSSANLTDYAMNFNMEMGILLSGGDLPLRVQNHFDELISTNILSEIINRNK